VKFSFKNEDHTELEKFDTKQNLTKGYILGEIKVIPKRSSYRKKKWEEKQLNQMKPNDKHVYKQQ
jgi:hypothetical protein